MLTEKRRIERVRIIIYSHAAVCIFICFLFNYATSTLSCVAFSEQAVTNDVERSGRGPICVTLRCLSELPETDREMPVGITGDSSDV